MTAPTALTISFADTAGVAGTAADLRTFSGLKVHGLSVTTLISARTPEAVHSALPVPAEMIADQIAAARETTTPDAIKTGVIGSAAGIGVVVDALGTYFPRPVIVDAMLVGRGGAVLMDDETEAVFAERLLPRATVLIVNLDEAARLTGTPRATTLGDFSEQGEALLERGPGMVLLSAGRGDSPTVTDILVTKTQTPLAIRFDRVEVPGGGGVAGAGCTQSAAIAAHAAHQMETTEAVQYGALFTQGAIAAAADGSASATPTAHQLQRMWEARAAAAEAASR